MNQLKDVLARIFTRQLLLVTIMAAAIFMLLVLFMDQVAMPLYTKHGEALPVPNILAKRFETAREILEQQGLEAVKAGEKHDPNLPFGFVLEQNPRPDRLVKKGRRVYLTISVGEREVQVPQLVGLSENNAKETLKSFGFRVGEIEYEYDPNEPPEVVIYQSIPGDALANSGTAVDMTVSLGKPTENVTVPSVFGKPLQLARKELKKSGLIIGEITYRVDPTLLPNTILSQSPEAGEVVPFGQMIDLLATVINEADLEN